MDIHEEAIKILSKLTLEEKCKLCVGKNFWQLYDIESKNINSIWLSDGPHGVRKEKLNDGSIFNNEAEKSICYPTQSAMSSTFDENLIFKLGKALGEECREKDISVLLGPGANEKRIPICGRNFEYFSEDPYLTGKMASSYIKGIQSQGVGASLKHFIGNNQEKYRMVVNSIIDERAMREIYLKGMEIAIREGNPWTVMMAYNKVNGKYCSENDDLISFLRDELKYENLIISDWGGVNSFVNSIKAGLNLEMPGYDDDFYKVITKYVEDGEISESQIDESVIKVIELILKSNKSKEIPYRYNLDEHIKLAQTIAEESAVLLKNEDNILPGNNKQKIGVIGQFAKYPRFQGGGSSEVNPITVDNAYDAFIESGCDISYADGYSIKYNEKNKNLLDEAVNTAKDKDIVYLFVGILKGGEQEGLDRKSYGLPDDQEKLIEAIGKVNKNLVVIIQVGSPIEMPWSDYCKGIILAHLGGSRGGHGIVNLLLGYRNPCGKLSETYPLYIKDCPALKYYPGEDKNAQYRESIYVGYRYYDTANKQVKYPFGYGLSYTTFEFSNLNIIYKEDDSIIVNVKIKNTGQYEGKEVVQIYISCMNSVLFRAKKELKAFKKVKLEPGESKEIELEIGREGFQYYNTKTKQYQIEEGYYKIQVGNSCNDIKISKLVYIIGDNVEVPDYRNIAPSYYSLRQKEFIVPQEEFTAIYGKDLPIEKENIIAFTTNSIIGNIKSKKGGKLIVSILKNRALKMLGDDEVAKMVAEDTFEDIPFRLFSMITRGSISRKLISGFVDFLNGKFKKGILEMKNEAKKLKE